MVNQCPIVTGNSFLYNFNSDGQAGMLPSPPTVERHSHSTLGTYWYHSHLSTQYCDGLRGAFVIYDPQDPHKDLYDVDDGMQGILTHSSRDLTGLQKARLSRLPTGITLLLLCRQVSREYWRITGLNARQ